MDERFDNYPKYVVSMDEADLPNNDGTAASPDQGRPLYFASSQYFISDLPGDIGGAMLHRKWQRRIQVRRP